MYTPEEVLTTLDFLDYEQGLEYCAYSTNLYLEALNGYIGVDSRYNELIKNYEEKNWETYRVCIHAVKSSSLIIGILRLFEKAKLIEAAVKEGNFAYVSENHPSFMKEYKDILSKLSDALKVIG